MGERRSLAPWDARCLASVTGRTYVVTGASGGIGYFVAEQLAGSGAHVVLAGRSPDRLSAAKKAVRRRIPDAHLDHVVVDLGDLASVRRAAQELRGRSRLDGLILNAAVLEARVRAETADGHELIFGTNVLGHFSLVAETFPALAATPASRVVTVGSFAHRHATLDFDDLESERNYRSARVYRRSKLAVMALGFELDRRLRTAGHDIASVVAHPGGAVDQRTPSRLPLRRRSVGAAVAGAALAPFVQNKEHAAWPIVRAALDPDAEGGEYFGPRYLGLRGEPVLVRPKAAATDPESGARLWSAVEVLAGVRFEP
jgi:NAD(P)-dependent dehydrogenase (short-subunit alcohol dehydrogenase family)